MFFLETTLKVTSSNGFGVSGGVESAPVAVMFWELLR